MQNTEEKVFYQDDDVIVTQTLFVCGSMIYAMRNISSVAKYIIPRKFTTPILSLLAGVIFLILPYAITRIGGVLFLIIGAYWIYSDKKKYSVRITTNAGEVDGFISTDEKLIQKIVDAVNNAMIYRG